ncbi:hypothetical protein BGZ94_003032 [Podila epigama]|nr:hypothetical protein BGZ94_003032 [Podila epigama]
MSYTYDSETKVHTFEFHCRGTQNIVASTFASFVINREKTSKNYVFSICGDKDSVSKMSMFNAISVRNKGKYRMDLCRVLSLNPRKTSQQRKEGMCFARTNNPIPVTHDNPQHNHVVIVIPQSMMKLTDGAYYIEFALTARCICVPTSSVSDMVLEGLYSDTKYADVTFVFEASATHLGPTQDEPEPAAEAQVLTAHKNILAHWPYFRTMFDSGFSEGETRPTRVVIKDTSLATFKALLRFTYTGKISEEHAPTSVYLNPAMASVDRSSWEDLFLVASLYDMLELCELAQKKMIACLDATTAIPFLFRTAYMFPDLRGPVVQFVGTTCGHLITEKTSLDKYRDHPDQFDILRELFVAIHDRSKA